jgi:hypothetical protein
VLVEDGMLILQTGPLDAGESAAVLRQDGLLGSFDVVADFEGWTAGGDGAYLALSVASQDDREEVRAGRIQGGGLVATTRSGDAAMDASAAAEPDTGSLRILRGRDDLLAGEAAAAAEGNGRRAYRRRDFAFAPLTVSLELGAGPGTSVAGQTRVRVARVVAAGGGPDFHSDDFDCE